MLEGTTCYGFFRGCGVMWLFVKYVRNVKIVKLWILQCVDIHSCCRMFILYLVLTVSPLQAHIEKKSDRPVS